MQLTIRLLRETDGRWIGYVPELPGVTVYGATPEEATRKAKALALRVVAEEIEHGEMPSGALMRELAREGHAGAGEEGIGGGKGVGEDLRWRSR